MICEICKKHDCHDSKHRLLEINGYYTKEGKKSVFKLTEIGKKLAEQFNIQINEENKA